MLNGIFTTSRLALFLLLVLVMKVRGVGLVCAIEFAANKETCEAFPAKWGMNLISLLISIADWHLYGCTGMSDRDGANAVISAVVLQLWERILLANVHLGVCWCAWLVTSS